MKEATFIKSRQSGAGAVWRHYVLAEPLDGHSYVIVSATVVPHSGPETYIFGADESGEVVDWMELDGSFRGECDHEQALANAGYSVT